MTIAYAQIIEHCLWTGGLDPRVSQVSYITLKLRKNGHRERLVTGEGRQSSERSLISLRLLSPLEVNVLHERPEQCKKNFEPNLKGRV